jgi:hypothetical protein
MLIGIRVGELLQACAVGVDPVEVGGAHIGLATEEHPVAFGRELWTISAAHLPGCDLMRILWRARRVEALDEHRRMVVSHSNPLEDQSLAVGREPWPEVRKGQRAIRMFVGDLMKTAPVEPYNPDPVTLLEGQPLPLW